MTYTFIFSFPCIVEEIMTLRYKYILRLAISGIWIYCYVLCERRLQFMYTNIWSVTVRNWMGDGVFHSYIDVQCYHLNINAAVYNPVTHSNVTNWIIGGSELDMPLRICIMSNARWWMHFFFFRWPVLNSLQCSTLPAPDNLASSDGFSPGIQCVKIFHHSIAGVFYQAS